jgi:hypothetical protein
MANPQKFTRDGRDWIYSPDSRTLISNPGSPPMGMVIGNRKKVSKTLMSPNIQEPEITKKRGTIVKVLATRG